VKVLRIARLYPRSTYPGSGLIPFKLSELLPFECLYVAKRLDGTPHAFPDHVRPVFIRYPEPAIKPGAATLGTAGRLLRWAIRIAGNAWLALRVATMAARFKPGVIHVHTPLPLAAAIVAKIVCRCPLVLTFHGTDYPQFARSRMLQRLVARYVDHVTCVAPDMVRDFQNRMPTIPVTDIGNGVDPVLFHPGTGARSERLITVGRLVWQKGYDDLLRAVVPAFEEFPRHRLLIVGQGPLDAELRQLAASLGIAGRVDFAGTLPQHEVAQALRESELFVMSSVSEGFPKALIEAMACGLPVITTRVGACADIVPGAGVAVAPSDVAALASGILSLLRDDAKRHAFAQQAVTIAGAFSWGRQARIVQEVYQDVIRRAEPK
jgi:glycosyltransferase involved in cell wall biosynthesis